MVNIQLILRMGSNIKTLNTEYAAKSFLDSGHYSTLMKTKSMESKSKTINSNLKQNPIKRSSKLLSLKIEKARFDIDDHISLDINYDMNIPDHSHAKNQSV